MPEPWKPTNWRNRPVQQMPTYTDGAALSEAERTLAQFPPLVFAASSEPTDVILENHRRQAEAQLHSYAREHLEGLKVETVVLQGFPHEAIVEVARARGGDLIVVGSHGHGFMGRVLMGSTAERILHIAPCPVLVVPSGR